MISYVRRIKRYVVQKLQTNIFSDSGVDKDIQAMLLPLNLMKTIVLSPKYRIRNDVITPNDIFNKFLLICGTVFSMFIYFYRIIHIFDDAAQTYVYLVIQDVGTFTDFFFNFSGFFMNFLIVLIHSKNYVTMVLTIQNVHRFANDEVRTNIFIRNNWIGITIFLFGFSLFFFYQYFTYPNLPFYILANVLALIGYDSDMIYAIILMKLLEDKVVQWNHRILFDQIETCPKKSFTVYLEILKSFNIYKMVTHLTVSLVVKTIFLFIVS